MAPARRGHIRQRSKRHPDRWTLYIYAGADPVSGRKHYRTQVFRGTRKEAEIRLTQLQAEMDRGENVEPSRERVEDFLRRWLRDYAQVRGGPGPCRDTEETWSATSSRPWAA